MSRVEEMKKRPVGYAKGWATQEKSGIRELKMAKIWAHNRPCPFFPSYSNLVQTLPKDPPMNSKKLLLITNLWKNAHNCL